MLSHTTQHDTQIQIVPSHTTQPDTQIQTLNATDIACHKCEPGAVLSHTMQHDTQIQTLHVIAMNLGWVLFHTMQPDADTPIQTLNAADITCHSCEPGGMPESKFLYIETIKLYCIVLYAISYHTT